MSRRDVMLVTGARTPFGKFGGRLRSVPSRELAVSAMKAALASKGISAQVVDEVYFGASIWSEHSLDGSIPARVASLRAGVREECLSLTVDRACCSSTTAIHLAAERIASGHAEIVLAGGADNMSRAAFLMTPEIRWGVKQGFPPLKDPMNAIGSDIGGQPVAVDAGEVAVEWGIDRAMTDAWAAASHAKYAAARESGFFDEEIVPFPYGEDSSEPVLAQDELPRTDTSADVLRTLPTVLGSPLVTAGNAPGRDAGACFVVLASSERCRRLGIEPLAQIAATASIARAPREIAVAPAPAIAAAAQSAGWGLESVDLLEVNEAFACVPLTAARVLSEGDARTEESLLARLNVNGGAVAIGHPPGASGARLALTLARELRRRGGARGVAAICGGLGQADAVAIRSA